MEKIYSYNNKTVNFAKIDEHAGKASTTDGKSFDSLVTYLKAVILDASKENAELLLARGLIYWIGHAQTKLIPGAPFNTPMNLVIQMVEGRIHHSNVYRTFCGYAGIDCKVVTGRCKAIRYRAGDSDSDYIQGHSWNILTVDGGRKHLVHPNWATHAVIGYAHGGEMMVEADGVIKGHVLSESHGQSQYTFNDFWFCLHPRIFVTRCLPDESDLQLLPPEEMVKSVQEFLALPDLRQAFYTSGLSLLTEKSCRLKSKKGICQINLLVDKAKPTSLQFSYELSLISPNNPKLNANDLPLHVSFSRSKETFEFEVRFPVVGEYRFKLKLHHEDTTRIYACCEFRIHCTEVNQGCKRLPLDSGIEGYGYGPSAVDAGLKNPSTDVGKVYVAPSTSKKSKDDQNNVLKFQVEEDELCNKEFVSNVYSVDGKGNTVALNDHSKTVLDPNACKVMVELNVAQKGEYSVVIGVQDKVDGKKGKAKSVLQYLVTTDKDVFDREKEMKKKKREVKKENKKNNKEEEKSTLLSEYEQLQTEIDENNLIDEVDGKRNGKKW